MRLAVTATVLFATTFAIAAERPDWDDLAALEDLATKVELEGHVEGKRVRGDLSVEFLKELPKPKELTFPTMSCTLDLESKFTRSYLEKYAALYDGLAKRCREVAKDQDLLAGIKAKEEDGATFFKEFLKKHPKPEAEPKKDQKKAAKARATNELRAMLLRISPVWERFREKAKKLEGKGLDEELAKRVESSKKVCKDHDYGKGIAEPRLGGSASIHYDLPKETYDLCRENLHILTAVPLTDKNGKPIEWRGKKVHWSKGITGLLGIQKTVEDLSIHEFYAVQYALKDQVVESGDKERPVLRLTGAQLLLGTYHFVEAGERIIVYLPEDDSGR